MYRTLLMVVLVLVAVQLCYAFDTDVLCIAVYRCYDNEVSISIEFCMINQFKIMSQTCCHGNICCAIVRR
jgi:hypothetical protein